MDIVLAKDLIDIIQKLPSVVLHMSTYCTVYLTAMYIFLYTHIISLWIFLHHQFCIEVNNLLRIRSAAEQRRVEV